MLLRARELTAESLGENSFGYARDLNNLAELYCATNRSDDAKSLFEEAISIAKNTLGEDHPNTKLVIANFARNFPDTNV